MQRKHEYRGKDRDSGKWVYGSLDQSNMDGHCAIISYSQNNPPVIHQVDPATVGEFTGYIDDVDNKVFEDDVFAVTGYFRAFDDYKDLKTYFVVVWDNKDACFDAQVLYFEPTNINPDVCSGLNIGDHHYLSEFYNNQSYPMIIGNIHDKEARQ